MKGENIIKNLSLGGLFSHDKNSVDLRAMQIEDGVRIHTCINYGESLEVIKLASIGKEKKLKLLTKIYFKYPDFNHVRFRPLIEQLDEIVYRLGFVPTDWIIQICCYCNLNQFKSYKAQEFFFKINKKYKIERVFLEYYPVYKYNFSDLSNLNIYYGTKKISFGLIGYQNLLNRVFSDDDIKFLYEKSISLMFIGFLGKGIQNKIIPKYIIQDKEKIDIVSANIAYFISLSKKYGNIEGITQVSSFEHYEDLKQRFLEKKACSNYLEINKSYQIYYFKNYDQYGGYIPYQKYFKNPKLLISRIKYLLMSNIFSLKFGRNFWG